ncbi:YadA-like family protein [Glaesserella parasuis]|nr:YadA-like family protein [Glaesserella parasuis]
MNKIFRVIWSHAQQAWVVVSELVKSHTKTSAYTDKRAQVCTSDYFLDKQQDKFKLSLLSLVLLGIFFSPSAAANAKPYLQDEAEKSSLGYDDGTIGIGKKSKAGYGAIAIGQYSKAEARHNIAIGYTADSGTQANSIAIGNNTVVSGTEAVAIGSASKAGGRSVVLGGGAEGTTTQTVVIGNLAKAIGSQSVAIGANTKAEGYGSISIGGDDLDQTNYHASNNTKQTRHTTTAKGKASVAIGGLSLAEGEGSIVLGPLASASKDEGIAIGANSKSTDEYGIAVGGGAAAGKNAVAVGRESKGTGANSIAIGNSAKTTGADSVVVGASINVTDGQLVAIGYQASAKSRSTALGYKASAGGMHSVAVGEEAVTNQNINRATALGSNSLVIVGGGVALGYGSRAETAGDIEGAKQSYSVTAASSVDNGFKSTGSVDNNPIGAVSVGNNRIKRQITNVAAGKVDTDAVNVAQLKSLTMQTGGDNGSSGKVGIWSGKLEVKGTSGEIKTNASNSTITIGLEQDVKTKLAQIADKMSSFNIKTDKDNTEATIKDGNTIQFTAGNNISITRNDKNLTFTVNSGTFGSTNDGRLSLGMAGPATVGDVVNAVNNAGWKLAIAKGAGEATPPAAYLIKMGDTATFTAGNNIKLEQKNGNITISTIIGKLIQKTETLDGGLKITYTDGSTDTIAKGRDGATGERGPAGPAGPRGETGPAGPVGPVGPKGEAGPAGERGEQGPIGKTGPAGPQGPAGATGPAGEAGPRGEKGPKGDKGEQGERGETGPQGAPGPVGPQGPTGAKGEQGPRGEQGTPGVAGPKGDRGETGPAGPRGETGPAGPVGPAGPTGPKGDTGPAGPKGEQGLTGQTGPQGPVGPQGPQGIAGATGPKGNKGDPGPKGDRGETGPAGPAGAKGDQGIRGPAGVSVSGDLSDITSISNGDTKVSLGKDEQGNPVVNMNGARITNIGDGSTEGDVVNVRQLNTVVSSMNAGFNQLSKDIGRVDVNARAGIASAGAMANLPQVNLPGKSAISVSGAQYRGQAAYAIGYSKISDNGKWVIRASVSSNTQRDTMIGGGVGFVW